MDKNNIIGLVLIFILTMGYLKFVAPSPEEVAENERIQDSTLLAQNLIVEETASIDTNNKTTQNTSQAAPVAISDSLQDQLSLVKYGAFAAASNQTSEEVTLENEKMKITFSSKGGKIVDVLLKDYKKIKEDSVHARTEHDLHILEDTKNKFEYLIPYSKSSTGILSTADLNFTPEKNGNSIVFRAQGSGGESIIQSYTLLKIDSTKHGNAYTVDYNIELEGMGQSIPANNPNINLHWVEYLDKIELNNTFEKTYSTTYFKVKDENADDLSAMSDEDEETITEPIEWISHSNQFFNASLIPATPFPGAKMQSTAMEDDNEDLKLLVSDISIPLSSSRTLSFPMKMYLGPNEFENLRAFGNGLEDVIPYGWSIFGTINRWIIRPLFDFLASFIGSMGISIIVLTLIVKLLLYPLTYKMLHSQAKMSALKPEIAKMKEKHKDDSQKTQMETMKLYREYGVNPLGGCMPMILQMPIWFALYRFFPAAIAFRQKPFWWATDLSSFDVLAYLPFEIPMVGAHISLFTILWAITTLIYTYYNSKMMDMSANPAMKYMQYVMPIMFLGFFNNYAAGLTAYLFFSNLINITQTLVTKKLVFSDEKLRAELHLNKAKPKKKKSGFQARLESAMKEQQRIKDNKKDKK